MMPRGGIGRRPAHPEVHDSSKSLSVGRVLSGYRTYSSRELQCYGHVVDVYIAYRNRKRQWKPTTFAFVRFGSLAEAKWAVKNVDNRKMDGFCIKVFLTKEEGEGAAEKKPVQLIRTKNKWRPAIIDKRSFKEALMGVPKPITPKYSIKADLAAREIEAGIRVEFKELKLRQLTTEDSLSLERSFTLEEIKAAIWSCDDSKAPGRMVLK
ncbi:hypothetical protein V6N12_002752 [Hibiscus sabdariffa]|uniref:RRM domain-containing protein n=1 Tax=Hibiscus sabdariffa TaxID=183260 RepID=A0ABR2EBF6_9ROSI